MPEISFHITVNGSGSKRAIIISLNQLLVHLEAQEEVAELNAKEDGLEYEDAYIDAKITKINYLEK